MSSELSKQSKFEDSARALELFLASIQAMLEPEDPNKSSDELVIRDRLDELKDACRQMRLKQQDLDSLNDLGYRLPLNKEDAERLHVINNRWLDLSSEATERQRGLQSCLLHQQNFNEKLEEWMLYLAEVEKDLAAPIAGNYPKLLEQQAAFEVLKICFFSFWVFFLTDVSYLTWFHAVEIIRKHSICGY